jgi:hypothetical protein
MKQKLTDSQYFIKLAECKDFKLYNNKSIYSSYEDSGICFFFYFPKLFGTGYFSTTVYIIKFRSRERTSLSLLQMLPS